MNAQFYWKLFAKTGAPRYYLLYRNAVNGDGGQKGRSYGSDDTGTCPAGM